MKRLRKILATANELAAEALEPRILYSAAPVEAPAEDAPVQEAPAQASTVAAAALPTQAVEQGTAAPVSVTAVPGASEIDSGQTLDLVAVDEASGALNQETVELLAAEARQRWIDSGISELQIAALDAVEYQVADVGGAHLGVADGSRITIDDDAGGTGVDRWFVDSTPAGDDEFGGNVSSSVSGRFDLLSTLIHEQGHVLGLGDIFGSRTHVMDGFLDAGTRRLPVMGQADSAVAGSMSGANFLTANIVRGSTDVTGVEASGGSSTDAALSESGRYLAFASDASNLVGGDTNGLTDVFVKDLQTGEVTRVSTDSTGAQSVGGLSLRPSISADGRYVAFTSQATNLVSLDTNGKADVFLKDLETGITTRVSTDSAGAQTLAAGASDNAAISGDGRYVAFMSSASNLVDGDTNVVSDIFRKDLKTGKTILISSSSSGEQGVGGQSNFASISDNGRYIVFESMASGLVPEVSGGVLHVYLKDVKNGKTTLLSTDAEGVAGDGNSSNASISADGLYVAFRSQATNLVEGDINGAIDIFVRDVKKLTVSLVSSNSAGVQGSAHAGDPALSADGEFVVFSSLDSDLVTGDDNGFVDVFVKNISTGEIERVSTSATGDQAMGGHSSQASISADGRFVAFGSAATNLVDSDTNGEQDVFVKGVGSLTRTFTTSVDIDAAGNLVIEDIDGADTKDNLFIGLKGGVLEISDTKMTVGSSIAGTVLVGSKGRGVTVDLGAFSGDIFVRTLGGEDTISIGDLSGLSGGFFIESGDGQNTVKQKGDVVLTGAARLSYFGKTVRLEKNSSISTESGDVNLLGNTEQFSTNKSVGVRGRHASVSTLSGDILFYGFGGVKGSGNRGIDFASVDVNSDSGNVSILGTGGKAVSRNRGVHLSGGSIELASGNLSITGLGDGTGGGNQGIYIRTGSTIEVGASGSISMTGHGAGTGVVGDAALTAGSYNRGVSIRGGATISTLDGSLAITGQGGSGKSHNVALEIFGSTIEGIGDGAVTLTGVGSVDSTGSSNMGTLLRAASVLSNNSALNGLLVQGFVGSGKNSNYGVRIISSTLSSSVGDVGIVAVVGSGVTTGNSNGGTYISSSTIESKLDTIAYGVAGDGKHTNVGFRLRNTTITSDIGIALVGTSSAVSTGNSNRGLYIQGGEFVAPTATLIGEGGSGVSNNESLRIVNATVEATADDLLIEAGGTPFYLGAPVGGIFDIDPISTGSNNRGAYISNTTLSSTGDIVIDAQAGGGLNRNVGAELRNSTLTAAQVTIEGDADAATTGKLNRGVYLHKSNLSAAQINLAGTAGGGSRDNQGVRADGGSFLTSGGIVGITGQARSSTSEIRNSGVYLLNGVFFDAVTIDISGTGGGGTGMNYGVYMHRKIIAPMATIDGTATDGVSEDKAGDYFDL